MTGSKVKYTVADLETMPAMEAYKLVMKLPNVDRTKLLAEILENNPELHADLQAQELVANLNANVADEDTDND